MCMQLQDACIHFHCAFRLSATAPHVASYLLAGKRQEETGEHPHLFRESVVW